MKYTAQITIMPLKNLLDPQGKAVKNTLDNLGYKSIENVRIGKHIVMELEADNIKLARKLTDEICRKILINPVVETYSFELFKQE